MFFVASKLIWLVLQPLSVIFLLLLGGMILMWRGRRRAADWVHASATAIIVLTAFTNLGDVIIQPLENRFARPNPLPERISAIVVLGGATDGRVGYARGLTELNDAGDRLTEAVVLARRYPLAPVLVSGGVGGIGAVAGTEDVETDAASGQRFLVEQGVLPERIVLDATSRNTDENAVNSRELLAAADAPILLVTSGFHMPRSVGLYRAQGFEVVPWPVDYRSTGTEGLRFSIFEPLSNLTTFTVAMREWVGLAAYWATGRIETILPGAQ